MKSPTRLGAERKKRPARVRISPFGRSVALGHSSAHCTLNLPSACICFGERNHVESGCWIGKIAASAPHVGLRRARGRAAILSRVYVSCGSLLNHADEQKNIRTIRPPPYTRLAVSSRRGNLNVTSRRRSAPTFTNTASTAFTP